MYTWRYTTKHFKLECVKTTRAKINSNLTDLISIGHNHLSKNNNVGLTKAYKKCLKIPKE
jgi:hypothetical protein